MNCDAKVGNIYVWGLLLINLVFLPGSLAADNSSLDSVLKTALKYESTHRYDEPERDELMMFQTLFARLIQIIDTNDVSRLEKLDEEFQKTGFTIKRIQLVRDDGSRQGVTILCEKDNNRRGSGVYVIADTHTMNQFQKMRPTILECPHARSDAFTGQLGLRIFKKGEAAAYFSSSMRRNVPTAQSASTDDTVDPEDDPMDQTGMVYHDADPAHNENSFFQAAHKTWMRRHPTSLVIQLHGFKQDLDNHQRSFDLILSNGLSKYHHAPFFLESERLLRLCLPAFKLGVYGRDTDILGALTNVQGKYVNTYTSGTFWHLEMARTFRDNLINDFHQKELFINCINQLITAYEKI